MNNKQNISEFKSLLEEKQILNRKLTVVYDLIINEKYDEALYELENLNKRYPYIADVFHLKYKIYCIKGNYNLAGRVLREAEVKFKNNEKIKADRIQLNAICNSMKNSYLKNGEYERLIEKSNEEIKEKGNNEDAMSAYYYRALSYRLLGDKNQKLYYNEANKVYNNMHEDDNENLESYLYEALCYRDLKEYGKALKLVNHVLSKDKDNKEAIKIKSLIVRELSLRKRNRF